MLVKRTHKEKLQAALNEIGVPSSDYPANLHNAYGLISAALMEAEDGGVVGMMDYARGYKDGQSQAHAFSDVNCKRHSFRDLADRARMKRGIRIANILLFNSCGKDEFFEAAQIVLEASECEA